jgi:TRAP-type mannitol/chloroaromatic compound transport system permease small subunit
VKMAITYNLSKSIELCVDLTEREVENRGPKAISILQKVNFLLFHLMVVWNGIFLGTKSAPFIRLGSFLGPKLERKVGL